MQTREEMQKKIMAASNRKILRRQMELLAEYSRTSGTNKIPASSEAMTSIHKELVKAETLFFVRVLIALFTFTYFFLDNAMDLICKEMNGRSTENVMILAKVLRDIMVARAILTEMTDTLGKF